MGGWQLGIHCGLHGVLVCLVRAGRSYDNPFFKILQCQVLLGLTSVAAVLVLTLPELHLYL